MKVMSARQGKRRIEKMDMSVCYLRAGENEGGWMDGWMDGYQRWQCQWVDRKPEKNENEWMCEGCYELWVTGYGLRVMGIAGRGLKRHK